MRGKGCERLIQLPLYGLSLLGYHYDQFSWGNHMILIKAVALHPLNFAQEEVHELSISHVKRRSSRCGTHRPPATDVPCLPRKQTSTSKELQQNGSGITSRFELILCGRNIHTEREQHKFLWFTSMQRPVCPPLL